MARKKKANLPPSGAAFAFPIGDGRYSVCRVILGKSSKRSKAWNGDVVLVACSSWIGKDLPDANDPSLRPILHLTHHKWDNKRELMWISDEVPPELIPIGGIEPTREEQEMDCETHGLWTSLLLQPLLQWRWDNQREVALAEDRMREDREAAERAEVRRERDRYLAGVTIDELRQHEFFAGWKEYPPPKAVRASRKVMAETVGALAKLGPDAPEAKRMAVLRRCIESFNRLDAEMQFIETVEREDICEIGRAHV